ncbi:MAG: 1-acyl-sn-glycerol-3-phosphate acyltransferase [Deltaproteobacteria bacterium]|nr:1-acyl-sn-glycerol-3-phosphate acyltransferase [Deltaproteobacteria bacterium]
MDLKARAAAATLRTMGWTFVTPPPAVDRCVGLAMPHTSNMDGLLLVLMAQKIGLEMSWMVKDAIDKPVLGQVVRGVGGVFIERSRAHGVVDQMIEQFARRDSYCLIIPPEGSRSRRDYWKSGFYHIALGAKVPVVPGFLDYENKEGGFGPPIYLTGDVHADMDAIRAFYQSRSCVPRYPEKLGPMRLREEDAPREPT